MNKYCIDTNFLIQLKNGPYDFEIAPGFWKWLEKEFSAGTIYSSSIVYKELVDGNDNLAEWIKKRKNSKVFIAPNDIVQTNHINIANYVVGNYPYYQAQKFLSKADPWVIAQAMVDNDIVVTFEVIVSPESQKVKIPNICKVFDVSYVTPYIMMRHCKARFEFI